MPKLKKMHIARDGRLAEVYGAPGYFWVQCGGYQERGRVIDDWGHPNLCKKCLRYKPKGETDGQ